MSFQAKSLWGMRDWNKSTRAMICGQKYMVESFPPPSSAVRLLLLCSASPIQGSRTFFKSLWLYVTRISICTDLPCILSLSPCFPQPIDPWSKSTVVHNAEVVHHYSVAKQKKVRKVKQAEESTRTGKQERQSLPKTKKNPHTRTLHWRRQTIKSYWNWVTGI